MSTQPPVNPPPNPRNPPNQPQPNPPQPAADPAVRAFLGMIAWSEGTSTSAVTVNNGYDVIVTGVDGPEVFVDYTDHPFAAGRPAKIVRPAPNLLTSTASGRYQLLLRWWRAYKEMLHLPDFSPASQDAVAIRQMSERGALVLLAASDIEGAITACANIWASLPVNDYGQGGHTMEVLLAKYQEFLGKGGTP